jgi:hypothetical protein
MSDNFLIGTGELPHHSSEIRKTRLNKIVAIVEELDIVDLVNKQLPKLRHHKLTHCDVVMAIILNGLGFTQRRSSTYFRPILRIKQFTVSSEKI